MSITSWKEEFYPKKGKPANEKEAIELTLLKHIGLLPDNMKAHGLTFKDLDKCDLVADMLSCHLCKKRYPGKKTWKINCGRCPCVRVFEGTCENFSAMDALVRRHDPTALITMLLFMQLFLGYE